MHEVQELAPPFEYVPAGQEEHTDAPGCEYVPGGQEMHSKDCDTGEKEPAPQGVQIVLVAFNGVPKKVWEYPALQAHKVEIVHVHKPLVKQLFCEWLRVTINVK